MSFLFSSSVLGGSTDFSKYYIFLDKDDKCAVGGKASFKYRVFGLQNGDFRKTYSKLLALKPREELVGLDLIKLQNIKRYVISVETKVNESNRRHVWVTLLIKLCNLFRKCFRLKPLDIHTYQKGAFGGIKKGIDDLINEESKDNSNNLADVAKNSSSSSSSSFSTSPVKNSSFSGAPSASSLSSSSSISSSSSSPLAASGVASKSLPSALAVSTAGLDEQPLVFGEDAFIINKHKERPSFDFTDKEIEILTSGHEYQVYNKWAQPPMTVAQMIQLTAKNGFPALKKSPEYNEIIRMNLRYLLYMISDKSEAKENVKQNIKDRLIEAFQDCQAIQVRTVEDLYNDHCTSSTLAMAFKIRWETYKKEVFDLFIQEKHPETKENSPIQSKQLPHVKSAYMAILGDDLGLPGKDLAIADSNKPNLKLNKNTLISEFKKKLNTGFIKDLCEKINNPADETIDKELVFKWGKSHNIDFFGFYDEEGEYGKPKNYDGITPYMYKNDPESAVPYISIEEARSVLVEAKILAN